MGRMAARWVLKHVYEQAQDVQQVFEPELVERDSVAVGAGGIPPERRNRRRASAPSAPS